MGTIIEFPADAGSRRLVLGFNGILPEGMGTVLILPVVRIVRDDETNGGSGPEEGTAPGRRRRRR